MHQDRMAHTRRQHLVGIGVRMFLGAMTGVGVALIGVALDAAFTWAFDREAHIEDLRSATGAQPYSKGE